MIFVASEQKRTLIDLKYRPHLVAQNGENGKPKNQKGKDGEDLVVLVPVGTVVKDPESGKVLADLNENGKRFVAARGGEGGRGNSAFASPTFQIANVAEKGKPGEERWYILELRFIADVGIIGLPNAGKSTLLKALTRARPKIAPYPFTTVVPNLGVMELDSERRLYIVDIPGLVEGAHRGKGLGNRFLKHIERAKIYVHLIDITGNPPEDYNTVIREIESYNRDILKRKMLIVMNKIDLVSDRQRTFESCLRYFGSMGHKVHFISALTGEGVEELKEAIWNEWWAFAREKP